MNCQGSLGKEGREEEMDGYVLVDDVFRATGQVSLDPEDSFSFEYGIKNIGLLALMVVKGRKNNNRQEQLCV